MLQLAHNMACSLPEFEQVIADLDGAVQRARARALTVTGYPRAAHARGDWDAVRALVGAMPGPRDVFDVFARRPAPDADDAKDADAAAASVPLLFHPILDKFMDADMDVFYGCGWDMVWTPGMHNGTVLPDLDQEARSLQWRDLDAALLQVLVSHVVSFVQSGATLDLLQRVLPALDAYHTLTPLFGFMQRNQLLGIPGRSVDPRTLARRRQLHAALVMRTTTITDPVVAADMATAAVPG